MKRATGMSMSTCHHIYVYFRKAYTNKKTGELYKVGEIATFPLLADTLETIAKEGPETFYNGTLSQKILLDLQEGSMEILFFKYSQTCPCSHLY